MSTTMDHHALMSAEQPDFLEGIALVHGAMRRDAARLPGAVRRVTDRRAAVAVRRWFERFALEVEHHHLREDEIVWPELVRREPTFGHALGGLAGDHHALDRAMAATSTALRTLVADPTTAVEAAATALALADLLVAHLDREEAAMFPVMGRVFTPEEFEALEKELLAATPKRLVAFELPFAFEGQPPERVAALLDDVPAVIRVLHRLLWQPAYRRLVAPLVAPG